jgi:hypothetical protein
LIAKPPLPRPCRGVDRCESESGNLGFMTSRPQRYDYLLKSNTPSLFYMLSIALTLLHRQIHFLPPAALAVVLIGDSATGKTSFLQQLLKGKLAMNQVPTVGIEFWTKTIILDDTVIKGAACWIVGVTSPF